MACFHTSTHHPYVAHPILSLSLTALSLLLLVLVLLSVPGPIKGLYWFSVENQGGQDGPLHAGVLGWCGEFEAHCAPLWQHHRHALGCICIRSSRLVEGTPSSDLY